MIALSRPLIVLDCETTGLNPKVDRIIEIGFQVYEHLFPKDAPDKEWRSLINPLIPIPPEITQLTGISDESMTRCQRCGLKREAHVSGLAADYSVEVDHEFRVIPTFAPIAAKLATGFSDCDFAGKNPRFDLQFMAAEMARALVPWSYTDARIIDADRLEAIAEPRHLSDLHKKYVGHPHEDAHTALADVKATVAVLAGQLRTHQQLPRDLDTLHELQWPGWLTEDGSFRIVKGVARCQFGKHRNKAMKDIPVDYYDWLIRSDFPPDVKALATNAKLGKFPVAKV